MFTAKKGSIHMQPIRYTKLGILYQGANFFVEGSSLIVSIIKSEIQKKKTKMAGEFLPKKSLDIVSSWRNVKEPILRRCVRILKPV